MKYGSSNGIGTVESEVIKEVELLSKEGAIEAELNETGGRCNADPKEEAFELVTLLQSNEEL